MKDDYSVKANLVDNKENKGENLADKGVKVYIDVEQASKLIGREEEVVHVRLENMSEETMVVNFQNGDAGVTLGYSSVLETYAPDYFSFGIQEYAGDDIDTENHAYFVNESTQQPIPLADIMKLIDSGKKVIFDNIPFNIKNAPYQHFFVAGVFDELSLSKKDGVSCVIPNYNEAGTELDYDSVQARINGYTTIKLLPFSEPAGIINGYLPVGISLRKNNYIDSSTGEVESTDYQFEILAPNVNEN